MNKSKLLILFWAKWERIKEKSKNCNNIKMCNIHNLIIKYQANSKKYDLCKKRKMILNKTNKFSNSFCLKLKKKFQWQMKTWMEN